MEFSPYNFLTTKDPDGLAKHVSTVEKCKGEYLYQPPTRFTPIFEIVYGLVKIGSYSPDGKEVCYDVLQPGEFFGNLRYLDGRFFEFSRCLTSTLLRTYDSDFFKKITIEVPEVSGWFNHQIVKRWCRAEERLFSIRSKSPDEKVQSILKAYQSGIKDANQKTISPKMYMSLQDVADLTGLTRQTVSKVIRESKQLVIT